MTDEMIGWSEQDEIERHLWFMQFMWNQDGEADKAWIVSGYENVSVYPTGSPHMKTGALIYH